MRAMYLFHGENCGKVHPIVSPTAMWSDPARGVLLPNDCRIWVPTADTVTLPSLGSICFLALGERVHQYQRFSHDIFTVARHRSTTPSMYRRGLYPLYVWTLPSDVSLKTSLGGARERPASRKCCRWSVIRRRSADLNVTNVTSIMYLFDVHWTYYSYTERGCAS